VQFYLKPAGPLRGQQLTGVSSMGRRSLAIVLYALLFPISLSLDGTARAAWTVMDSSTTYELRGVWGSSATEVFAVGIAGVIVYYDGNSAGTWTPMQNSSS
jgi:hypothetical protein